MFNLKRLALVLSAVFLVSCAPAKPYILKDYQRDPEFILIEMLATGLVLGGVTVTAFPVTKEERNSITAQLEDVLTNFSFYKFNTPVALAKRVTEEKYEALLTHFQKYKTIPNEEIQHLKTLYTPARYVLFVNIDSNVVTQDSVHNPDSIDFISTRTISATLNIISLETAKPALFTRISYSDSTSNSIQRLRTRGGAGLLFGNIMAQVTFGGYPDPPAIEKTLYKLFLAIADQVPHN